MMKKRLLSLALCGVLTMTMLAGCGGSSDSGNAGGDNAGAGSAGGDAAEVISEHAEVTMLLISPNSNEAELNKIADKISEITEEKFNTTVHLMVVAPADYVNKMNMALATGDSIDIFQGFEMYDQYVAQDYMLDIEPYAEYWKDAAEVVGDTIKVSQDGEHTYGIPFMNLGGTGGDGYALRKDILDELNIDLDEVEGWDEFTDVLRQIKAAHPELTPFMGGGSTEGLRARVDMSTNIYQDTLGNSKLVTILDPENNSTVSAAPLNEGFKVQAEYAWAWAQEGLLGYDEVSESGDLVKAGMSAGMYYGAGPVSDDEATDNAGYEMRIWTPTENKAYIYTNNVWTWCVTDYTEYPEQALMVLNEFYINPELANLLEWGIEGEHYQIVDAENGKVGFLEGQHPGNVAYYNFIKDAIPNCYITYIGVDEKDGKWDLYQNFKEEHMAVSPYLGFTFKQDAVQNEVAACTNVLEKYYNGLLSGQLDPSTEYDKMVSELETASINKIVEEAQSQLDEWIANNQ